jgi:hypothetical protein
MSRQSDAYKAWYIEYYQINRQKIIEAARNRRLADPEAAKSYNREYYQQHKENIQSYNRQKKREYYKVNGDKIRERDRLAKAFKRVAKKAKKAEEDESPDARKLPRDYLPTERLYLKFVIKGFWIFL